MWLFYLDDGSLSQNFFPFHAVFSIYSIRCHLTLRFSHFASNAVKKPSLYRKCGYWYLSVVTHHTYLTLFAYISCGEHTDSVSQFPQNQRRRQQWEQAKDAQKMNFDFFRGMAFFGNSTFPFFRSTRGTSLKI